MLLRKLNPIGRIIVLLALITGIFIGIRMIDFFFSMENSSEPYVQDSTTIASSTPASSRTSGGGGGTTSGAGSSGMMPAGNFVQVVYPNGGEKLCLGKQYKIQWRSNGVTSVGVFIRDRYQIGDGYFLGAYRATSTDSKGLEGYGSVIWKVGDTQGAPFPAAANYEILIQSAVGDKPLDDTSDKIFSAVKCQG